MRIDTQSGGRIVVCGLLLALLTIAPTTGCSSGNQTVAVKGNLLLNGQPFAPASYDPVMIILYPDAGGATIEDSYPANVNEDGSLEVPGRDGNGIPPGKYRVSIEAMSHPERKHLRLPADVKGPQSRLVCEVGEGKEQLPPIDLAKP